MGERESSSLTPEYSEGLLEQSSAVMKLQHRISAGQRADVLASDIHGVVLVPPQTRHRRTGRYLMESNWPAMQMLQDKSVPVMYVTGLQSWDDEQDEYLGTYGIARGDVISAGTGSLVYWRDEQGQLRLDEAYAQRMKAHPVTLYGKNGYTVPYSPGIIASELSGAINRRMFSCFRDMKVIENDGAGVLSIKVSGAEMEEIQALHHAINGTVGGIKIAVSESQHPENRQSSRITGDLHVIPNIAGKDRSLRYILGRLSRALGDAHIHAHAIGDATVDVPMLAMGSGTHDPYTVHGYLVANATIGAGRTLRPIAVYSRQVNHVEEKTTYDQDDASTRQYADTLHAMSRSFTDERGYLGMRQFMKDHPIETIRDFHDQEYGVYADASLTKDMKTAAVISRQVLQGSRHAHLEYSYECAADAVLDIAKSITSLDDAETERPQKSLSASELVQQTQDHVAWLEQSGKDHRHLRTWKERYDVYRIAKDVAEYIVKEKIPTVFFLDRGAAFAQNAIHTYWDKKLQQVLMPDMYRINPKGFFSREWMEIMERQYPGFGEHLMMKSLAKSDVDYLPTFARSSIEIQREFQESFPHLAGKQKEPLLIFDTCIHDGFTMQAVTDHLSFFGFSDIRIGVMTNHLNTSKFEPDIVGSRKVTGRPCYIMHMDSECRKTFRSIFSATSDNRLLNSYSRRAAKEIEKLIPDFIAMPELYQGL